MRHGGRLLPRPLVGAVVMALLAAAATAGVPLRAGAVVNTFGCGDALNTNVPPPIYAAGPGGMGTGTVSSWTCQGDLLGVEPSAGNKPVLNGGSAANSTFSSGTDAVPEECITTTTPNTCGRGEAGYGGGELPFSSVLIDAQDSTQNPNSDIFACASGGSVVASTETGAASSGKAPALAYHPGTFAGGEVANGNGNDGTVSGDTQCYTPYEQCTSAPTGNATLTPPVPNASFCSAAKASNSVPGKVYLESELSSARELAAAFYVPDATGNGSACAGKIIVAGGIDSSGNELASAYAFDPRYELGGTPPTLNANFNTWSSALSSSLGVARDTMAVVQLTATTWLLAGGETATAASSEYDIFTANGASACTFSHGTLPNSRYDFGMAKFGGFGSDVLACGGTNNFTTFAALTSCDLYNASAGTWATQTTGLTDGRNGAFGQFLPSITATPTILMAGSDSTSLTDSEECTENTTLHTSTCGHNVLADDTTPAHLGFDTTQAQAFVGISDSSHVLVGCIPTENACATAGYSSNTLNQTVLECGGFNATGGGSGNDTIVTCEYYVPSSFGTIPSLFTSGGVTHCKSTTTPTWCTTPASHMNRERAYFSLFEFPALSGTPTGGTQATSDEFIACGGFYGEGDGRTFSPYLMRKNCEGLTKGSG